MVLNPVARKGQVAIKAKFNALFLGDAQRLVSLMDEKFPELSQYCFGLIIKLVHLEMFFLRDIQQKRSA